MARQDMYTGAGQRWSLDLPQAAASRVLGLAGVPLQLAPSGLHLLMSTAGLFVDAGRIVGTTLLGGKEAAVATATAVVASTKCGFTFAGAVGNRLRGKQLCPRAGPRASRHRRAAQLVAKGKGVFQLPYIMPVPAGRNLSSSTTLPRQPAATKETPMQLDMSLGLQCSLL